MCDGEILRSRYHNHRPAYKLHQDSEIKEYNKEKDLEIEQTLTHNSIKNSKFEPLNESENGDQENTNEDYDEMKSKIARSADQGENEKCDDANGQDRRDDFMGTWSRKGNSKKTLNIALKAAQEAKAAEEGKKI